MERNEFALAGALMLIVFMTLVLSLVATAAIGTRPTEWAAWVQAVGAIAAIVGAAAIGRWQASRDDARRSAEQNERWRIAELEVAAHIRAWLREAVQYVSDNKTHVDSDGHAGQEYHGVPEFGFAGHLDRVSAMRPALALEVFALIQRADRLRSDIAADWDMGGSDDSYHRMMLDLPNVFFRARSVYRKIAVELGLPPRSSRKWEVQLMHAVRNRQREIESV